MAAMSEKPKLTNENAVFSRGNTAVLIRIFLIKGAESMMDFMALLVASDMNVNRIWPRIR